MLAVDATDERPAIWSTSVLSINGSIKQSPIVQLDDVDHRERAQTECITSGRVLIVSRFNCVVKNKLCGRI